MIKHGNYQRRLALSFRSCGVHTSAADELDEIGALQRKNLLVLVDAAEVDDAVESGGI